MSEVELSAPPTQEPAPPRRRSLWRTAFYTASLSILLWAGTIVPLPVVEYVPGPPSEIEPLVMIDGVATTELDGRTALLTVVIRQQATLPSIRALLDTDRELLQLSEVYPDDVDRDTYLQMQRNRFGRQFDIAAAMGAQAAGFDPDLVTEVVVLDVLADSPAEGRLLPGDAVIAVDGVPIEAAEELQSRAREGTVGEDVVLTVVRDRREHDVIVTLGDLPQSPYPALGVIVETAVDRLVLPFDLTLAEDTRIGGPSAGMMVGITVFDLLAEEDLLGGLTVVGTGTLDADGRVGPVGGIPQKMRAAAGFDADLVLVPTIQLETALDTAPDGLRVVGVDDLDAALAAIRAAR